MRSDSHDVPLPAQLSTTAVLRLQADPQAFAVELARPMPQPPSRAARFGTRFHLWVERYLGPNRPRGALGQQPLVDPDDLPDRADSGASGELELRELCAAFAAGQFGHTVPYALEAPFSVALGGRLVRGRIDAVYAETSDGFAFRVVDWKTSRSESADPLQLAIYRLAWAEANHIPLATVDAAFYYVRSDHLVRPSELADRPQLERLLAGDGEPLP